MKVLVTLRLGLCGLLLAPATSFGQARPHLTVGTVDQKPNVAPAVDLNGAEVGPDFSVTFTQGGGPVVIVDGDASDVEAASVTDDTNHLVSATIRLTNNLDGAAETLAVTATGTNIVASLGAPGADRTLTLSGFDSRSAYQQVLRTATYNNVAASPNTTERVIEFRLNDGSVESAVARSRVTIAGATPSPTPTPTATPTPSTTPTPTPTPSATPTPTATATPTPTPSPSPSPDSTDRLLNISSRLRVLTGDNVLIGGMIIDGVGAKQVFVRSTGPSLKVNGSAVPGTLQDPTLSLHDGSGAQIAFNDNWGDAPEPERSFIASSVLKPDDEREPAIVRTLMPGAYTAIVSGKGEAVGLATVELYDRDGVVPAFAATKEATAASRVANISTRGFCSTNDNLMISGGIIGGGNGGGAMIMARGLGPSIAVGGSPVSGRLPDPTLEIFDGNGASIAANNDWRSDNEQEIEDTGIAPANDLEAALIAQLPPGVFTAHLRGNQDSSGIGLLEIYELQPSGAVR